MFLLTSTAVLANLHHPCLAEGVAWPNPAASQISLSLLRVCKTRLTEACSLAALHPDRFPDDVFFVGLGLLTDVDAGKHARPCQTFWATVLRPHFEATGLPYRQSFARHFHRAAPDWSPVWLLAILGVCFLPVTCRNGWLLALFAHVLYGFVSYGRTTNHHVTLAAFVCLLCHVGLFSVYRRIYGGKKGRVPVASETVPKPVCRRLGDKFIYSVPGDGLCGVHSVLAVVPGLNYLSNLAYFQHKGWMDSLYNNALRPLLTDFALSWGSPEFVEFVTATDPYVPYSGKSYWKRDAENLRPFLQKTGFPENLSEDFLDELGKYLGSNVSCLADVTMRKPIGITHANNHFEPYFSSEYKDAGNHDRYIERLVAKINLVNRTKFTDYLIDQTKALALITGSPVPIEYTPRDPSPAVALTKAPETRRTGTKLPNPPKDFMESTLPPMDSAYAPPSPVPASLTTPLGPVAPLEPQPAPATTGALPGLANSPIPVPAPLPSKKLAQVLAESKAQPAVTEQPLLPTTPDTPISYTGITSKGAVSYECRYKAGPALSRFLDSKPITVSEKTETYSHPFLRTVSNWYWLRALAAGFSSPHSTIIDLASKYNHLSKFLQKAPRNKRVIAARPNLFAFDRAFNRRYAAWTSKWIEIDRSDRHVMGPKYKPLNDVFYVINDSLYYPDVIEGLRRTTGVFNGMANLIVYPHTAGTFEYADKEGTFTITPSGNVISRPKDNPSVYEHPVQPWNRSDNFSVLRKDGSALRFVPEEEVDVGGGAFFVSYRILDDVFNNDPLQDPVITGVYTLNRLDFHTSQRFDGLSSSLPVHTVLNREHKFESETFVPPKDLYTLLAPNVRSKDYESKFELQGPVFMANSKFPGVFSRLIVARTVMCILLDDAAARNEFIGFRADPRNRLKDITDFAVGLNLDLSALDTLVLVLSFLNRSALHDFVFVLLSSVGCPGYAYAPSWHLAGDVFLLAISLVSPLLRQVEPFFHFGEVSWTNAPTYWWRRFGGRVSEKHYDPATSNRLYWPMGNASVLIKKKTTALLCTCQKTYTKIFSGLKQAVTHFGGCKINVEASIFTRQCNALQLPNEDLAAEFLAFADIRIKAFLKAAPAIIESLKLDFSRETFLADTAPGKRRAYQKGFQDLDDGHWSEKISFFSKTDEVHVDNPNARPRNIGCFGVPFTVAGAYTARLMIKIAKGFFPGFTSGLNLKALGKQIEKAKCLGSLLEAFWYMADGAGFDASQWAIFLKHIDHVIGPALFDLLAPHLELPAFYFERIRNGLFSEIYAATSTKGDIFDLLGSVPSGHPLRTTLFNTIRCILFHEFALYKMGLRGIVFAAGDDALVKADGPVSQAAFEKILSPQNIGHVGLGVCTKDFKTGHLHEMDFLSKQFVTDGFRVEAYRRADKVANSGLYSRSIMGKLTRPIYAAMQALQLADLPARLEAAALRFRAIALRSPLPQWALERLKFDWSTRLYLHQTEKILDGLFYFLNPPLQSLFLGGRLYGGGSGKISHTRMPRNRKRNSKTAVAVRNQRRPAKTQRPRRPQASASVIRDADAMYIKSLHDPFQYRQVRIPSRFPVASQCSTFHGNAVFTTNANGYARVDFKCSSGKIDVYNDATHNETTIGPATNLVAANLPTSRIFRVCNAGMRLRSTASFANESGLIQAYSSFHDVLSNYDVFRDSPHQAVYSKGQVAQVRYLPTDYSCLNFSSPSTSGTIDYLRMGFMITGAVSQTYSIQYAITYEYVSSAVNTDSVPLAMAPLGDAHSHIHRMQVNNPAQPDSWTFHDILKSAPSASTLYRVGRSAAYGYQLGGGYGAVVGGVAGVLGYGQKQSHVPSGNLAILNGPQTSVNYDL